MNILHCQKGVDFTLFSYTIKADARAGFAFLSLLSHRMYLSIIFRKSTPPQNRQLIVYYN